MSASDVVVAVAGVCLTLSPIAVIIAPARALHVLGAALFWAALIAVLRLERRRDAD